MSDVEKKSDAHQQERLFSEFDVPSYADWRALVEADLQGVALEKKLHTKTIEGIELKPIYVRDDVNAKSLNDTASGMKPFLRASKSSGNIESGWEVAQELRMSKICDVAYAIAEEHEVHPVSSFVVFDRPSQMGLNPNQVNCDEVGADGVSFATKEDAHELLHSLRNEDSSLHLDCGSSGLETIALLSAASYQLHSSLIKLKGSLGFSLLTGCLSGLSGCCCSRRYFDIASQLSVWCKENAPSFIPLTIDTRIFVESGASATQELGFALALGAEYLRELISRGLSANEAASSILFRTGIGSNFFMEIAKFRALRKTWSKICEAFEVSEHFHAAKIHACTSRLDKSKLDVHTNMLRSTSQAFAAACAGVDYITVSPYSELGGGIDPIARRLARNAQLILQEESGIQRVIDSAGGSYFVETLTHEVAEKAWSLFQEVESRGGMLTSMRSGFVQDSVETTATNRARAVAERRDVLVGVSMYPNLKDELKVDAFSDTGLKLRHTEFASFVGKVQTVMLDSLSSAQGAELVEYAVVAASSGATLGELSTAIRAEVPSGSCNVRLLKPKRVAEGYERLRIASLDYARKLGKPPEVFLANMGPVRQHKARAEYSSAFFEPGGFKILGDASFMSAEDAAQTFIESGALIAVICSTDESYPDIVPVFVQAAKRQNPNLIVIVAGNPVEHIACFQQAGVDDFIHIRSNNQAKLEELLGKIGAL